MTTLVVVDDDAGFRRRVRDLLAAGGFRVVGEAGDGATARDVVDRLRPEVALVDVGLPDADGLDLARQLREHLAPLRVVAMSGRDASDFGARIAASGATGFIHKADLSATGLRALLEPGVGE
jgi:DNA-binding NarL/FixJ family response regulator